MMTMLSINDIPKPYSIRTNRRWFCRDTYQILFEDTPVLNVFLYTEATVICHDLNAAYMLGWMQCAATYGVEIG